MKTENRHRLAAVFIVLAMLLLLIPFEAFVRTTAKAATTNTYTFVAGAVTGNKVFAKGDKQNGDTVKIDSHFTVHCSTSTALNDGSNATSNKTFSEGGKLTGRLNMGGKTQFPSAVAKPQNCISFETADAATVKVWWVQGGGIDTSKTPPTTAAVRHIEIYDASYNKVASSADDPDYDAATAEKNSAYVSTFNLTSGGKYYLGNTENGNYFFKVEVVDTGTLPAPERAAWNTVDAPVVGTPTVGTDKITVAVTAEIGDDGGDSVVIEMLKGGTVVDSITKEESDPTVEFTPTASGNYTFRATLEREGETAKKTSAETSAVSFTLPLKTPTLSASSKGSGRIELAWSAVPEATKYVINDGTKNIDVDKDTTTYLYDGTVGTEYTFTVTAVRGNESTSATAKVTATAEAEYVWNFVYYGTSTGSSKNKHTVNPDGYPKGAVQISATGGGGKIQYDSNYDGLGFYWTRVSAADNFSLKSKVKVDVADSTGSQTGFGLLALDSYPANENSTTNHYTNQFMVGAYKFHHYWDFENNEVPYDNSGTKHTMQHGIGVTRRYNITDSTGNGYKTESFPLDKSHINPSNEDGTTYRVEYGNGSEFIFEIGRNNTGYYAAYYTPGGRLVSKQQFYDPDALSVLDSDSIYVGFFTGRVSTATFYDFELNTWSKASDNTPVEPHPITYINPAAPISSASVANSENYTLMMTPNVKGTISVSVNGVEEPETISVTTPKTVITKDVTIASGNNNITVTFTPLPTAEQGFESPYMQLRSDEAVTSEIIVKYDTYFANQKNLYVSPTGSASGNGGKNFPLDIYTAVKVAQPGQTIILMEGTYNLKNTVTIQRGVDGTAEDPIKMIADPEATTRPVLDFVLVGGGIRHGGNYWYFRGFDVTGSADRSTGFRVCGNNNTLDQINTYTNGNTGIQISAFRDSSDPKEMWPQNNLILNCNSYDNADAAGQDADGFAAKLTVGEGNVFDGCAAYNNCDDGWDLFAKPQTGNIGSVTIRNCIAYNNGHNLDNSIRGDGNGFKLGGSNMSGKHVLENSFAFNNDANGITSNSCPDVTVKNCTSYKNGSAGLTLYSSSKTEPIDFTVDGVVVCGNSSSVADNTNNTGSQIRDVTTATESDFESTTFTVLERNADGTLKLGNFLKLKDTSVGGADFDKEGGSTSSDDVETITPDENLPPIRPEYVTPTPSAPTTSGDSKPADDDRAIEFEDKENETDITVTAPEGAFDNAEDVKFNAAPVPEETNDEEFTFDLFFTDKDGGKVQPKVAVTVKIPVPEALKNKDIFVYHVESDGKYTEVDCKIENGMVVFTATSFSKYIITSKKLAAATSESNTSADNSGNSNPSTAVTIPLARFVVFSASAAALCIFRRKRS